MTLAVAGAITLGIVHCSLLLFEHTGSGSEGM